MMNTPFPDLRGEHRTEPVPPETYCLVAYIDATLKQQILDLSQRNRIPDVHHYREANYLRRTVEITEGILHRCKLRNAAPWLKSIWSDTAAAPNGSQPTTTARERSLTGGNEAVISTPLRSKKFFYINSLGAGCAGSLERTRLWRLGTEFPVKQGINREF